MDCKKCSYFESKREITNSGKVVVGFCKLRNKHISDLNIRKEFCKDRATVDIPAGAKTVAIKPEPSLYTDREKEMLSKAAQKSASQSSTTFAELAAKMGLADTQEKPSSQASVKAVPQQPKVEVDRNNRQRESKKPTQPENVQIIPPMKLTPEDAIRLLEQQQSGKVKASFKKDFGLKSDDESVIRKAAWGSA